MNQLQICLANNMKRFRKIKKYSQEKLAEKAGASANYIALIECGKSFPSLQMIEHIAKALEIDELDLLDKRGLTFQSDELLKDKLIEELSNTINTVFNEKWEIK